MTTKTWLGDASNSSTDPNAWSPSDVPQATDAPVINSGTINLADDNLAGDTLTATPGSTINLTDGSVLNAQLRLEDNISNQAPVTINLAPDTAIDVNDYYVGDPINATGGLLSGYYYNSGPGVNIAAGDTLAVGQLSIMRGDGSIGGAGTLNLTGSIGEDQGPDVVLAAAAITGTGTLVVNSQMEVGGAVGAGITADLGQVADLTLTDPARFQGSVADTISASDHAENATEHVILSGIQASSYTYANGALTLENGGSVVDTLRLQTPYVPAVTQDTNGVTVWAGGNATSGTPVPENLTAPAPASVAVQDTTTGQPVSGVGTPYSGPVAGLAHAIGDVTPDNLNISASTPGWFIHSGSGEDAIAVSSGTNVLDGGTGSNFLTGGSGTDTFFVDDRGPAHDVWNTVSNFHAGDAATVWGVTPKDFAISWADGQGTAGYTGLTMHAISNTPGAPVASLTLPGYTTADLSNGRLTTSFGTIDGNTFMNVQGY